MTNLEKLYREVAKELDLPLDEVTRICRFQFAYYSEQAGADLDTLPQVRLPLLASFQPMDWAVERRKKVLARKIENNYLNFGFHAY
jgi:hypothetical protein